MKHRNETALSEGRNTMGFMNAAEHWRAWLDRYGADYATDDELRAAYGDFKANLATLVDVFSTDTGHDNP